MAERSCGETFRFEIGPKRYRLAKPIILQSETLHFALQNHGFCLPICSILQAKTMGFANRGHKFHRAKEIESKSHDFVTDCNFCGLWQSYRCLPFPPTVHILFCAGHFQHLHAVISRNICRMLRSAFPSAGWWSRWCSHRSAAREPLSCHWLWAILRGPGRWGCQSSRSSHSSC